MPDFYRRNYGPVSRAFASLDVNGQDKLRSELVHLWSAHNYSDGNTTSVDAEYLEVVATRGSNILVEAQPTATHNIEGSTGRRSGIGNSFSPMPRGTVGCGVLRIAEPRCSLRSIMLVAARPQHKAVLWS